MTSFVSFKISASKPATFTPEKDVVLHLVNAAAEGKASLYLSVPSSELENALLCSLSDKLMQCTLDLLLPGGIEVEFSVKGKDITVCGWKQPFDEEQDDEEIDSEEEAADQEEDGMSIEDLREIKNAVAKKFAKDAGADAGSEDEDDDEDMEDGSEDMEEDSELDDGDLPSDISDDEDSEMEEPVVQKSKPVEKKVEKKPEAKQEKKPEVKKPEAKQPEAKKPEAKQPEAKKPESKPEAKKAESKQEKKSEAKSDVVKLPSGLAYSDMVIGTGPVAKDNTRVTVYYTGKLTNGKIFDSNTSGSGFKFNLGRGEVIKGWDQGVKGMKVGGKRRLMIPAELGYGKQGTQGIPGGAVLLFEVELLKA